MAIRNLNASSFSSPLQTIFIALAFLAISPIQAMVTYAMPLQGDEHLIGNLLEWKTSQEMRSKTFMVEKSLDGINYEGIGMVEAAGESIDEKGYRFLDINATSNHAYYRLKQVDTDGTSSLSQIAEVRRAIPNQFMVINMSPPATNTTFTCAVDAMITAEMDFQLYDLNNELIQSGKVEMLAGLNQLVIDLTNEAVGYYQLRLNIGAEVETMMLQKVLDEGQTKENVALKDND